MREPSEAGQLRALRHVLLSGEPIFPADVEDWWSRFGARIRFANLYGPSETTMTKFVHHIEGRDRRRSCVPIGKPIPGCAAAIVSETGQPCPAGTVGEIYIRTPYRSLGYYRQPKLTNEVFIANPLSNDPEDVVYKTGDLGRMLEDGPSRS